MKKLPDISYVNGTHNNFIPITDRGLAYGDGLFETILVLDGKLILEGQHLERLSRDSARLLININRKQLLQELILITTKISKENLSSSGVLKIIITRQSSGRGYGFINHSGSNRILQYFPGISYPGNNRNGVRIGLADYRLPDEPQLAGIKHLNRLHQVLMQTKMRKPFYQEMIVCGARGEILEGATSNLFIVKEKMIMTPKQDKAGVRGVMRDYILNDICSTLKLPSRETTIRLDDVLQADEVFICNSVFGIWPVNAIDVKSYAIGATTLAIQKQVDRLGYPVLYT